MSVTDIARASGMSILELARMVTTPDNLRQLHQVAQLHAIEREMMLGQLKRNALMRLAELTDEVAAADANEVRACEVMRKACVDLLRYGAPAPAPGSASSSTAPKSPPRDYTPEPLTPAFEAEVLEALERLGEEKYEEGPQIEDSPRRIGLGGFMKEDQSGGGTDSDRRELSVGASVENESSAFNGNGAVSCGCHGQVPPARACESSVASRANSLKQRACPWHPPRDPEAPLPPPPDKDASSNVIPGQSKYHARPSQAFPPSETTITHPRTGETPVPPSIRRAPDQSPDNEDPPRRNDNRIRFDDAHPP